MCLGRRHKELEDGGVRKETANSLPQSSPKPRFSFWDAKDLYNGLSLSCLLAPCVSLCQVHLHQADASHQAEHLATFVCLGSHSNIPRVSGLNKGNAFSRNSRG